MTTYGRMLAAAVLRLPLLAQNDRLTGLGSRFRRGGGAHSPGEIILPLFLLLLAAGAAWLLARLFHLDRWTGRHSPGRLFRQLCRAHGLDSRQRRLLRQLARAQRLDHPGRLFLEPERLDAARLSPALQPKAKQIAALQVALFLAPPQGEGSPPA